MRQKFEGDTTLLKQLIKMCNLLIIPVMLTLFRMKINVNTKCKMCVLLVVSRP